MWLAKVIRGGVGCASEPLMTLETSVSRPISSFDATGARASNRPRSTSCMEMAIRAHGGLVVQYIGDEIEAAFGAPLARSGHAEQAVRAAIEMRARLRAWNAARIESGRPPLRNGIGIHTGTVLAGHIGSAERLSYALVGDSVNLASRLQGLTKELHADVLVSGATRAKIDGTLPLRPLPAVRVKGRVAAVEVYALD